MKPGEQVNVGQPWGIWPNSCWPCGPWWAPRKKWILSPFLTGRSNSDKIQLHLVWTVPLTVIVAFASPQGTIIHGLNISQCWQNDEKWTWKKIQMMKSLTWLKFKWWTVAGTNCGTSKWQMTERRMMNCLDTYLPDNSRKISMALSLHVISRKNNHSKIGASKWWFMTFMYKLPTPPEFRTTPFQIPSNPDSINNTYRSATSCRSTGRDACWLWWPSWVQSLYNYSWPCQIGGSFWAKTLMFVQISELPLPTTWYGVKGCPSVSAC
jgi:hypothetical protein